MHEGIRKFKEMGLLCLFLDARGRLGLTISADRRTHRLSFLHNALFSSNCFVCLCFFKKLSYLDERRKVRTEHQLFFFSKERGVAYSTACISSVLLEGSVAFS